MVILTAFFILLTFVLCAAWVILFCRWIVRKLSRQNPYLRSHKMRLSNDRDYEEYIRWCDKHSRVPMDKVLFEDEVEIMRELGIRN